MAVCRIQLWLLNILLLISTLIFSVSARLNVNVALGRPTFISSTYYDEHGTGYTKERAVDGGIGPSLLFTDECVATANSPLPSWWAVDLLAALAVAGIKFFNRQDDYGDNTELRSNNFLVGLTDVSPDVVPPVLWNYTVCAQYPGTPPTGGVWLPCTSNMEPHRYVILHFPGSSDDGVANFCEVEVYLRRFDWRRKSGYRMNNRVASTLQTDRQAHCMNNCTVSPVCDSYNFREADNTCEFNQHAHPLEADRPTLSPTTPGDGGAPSLPRSSRYPVCKDLLAAYP